MDIKITGVRALRVFSFPEVILTKEDLIHPQAVYGIRGRNLDIMTDNGVGKTTAGRIIYYGLYGVDLFGTTLDHISNDHINGGHFVQVNFSVGDNDYLIMRFHDFSPYDGGPILEGAEKKNKFKGLRFYKIEGEVLHPIIGDSDSEVQDMINSILGISPKMAKNIFFIPQGYGSPLLTCSPAETQNLLMEFFPLEFVDDSKKKNEDFLKDEKARQKELIESKMRLISEIELKRKDLDLYNEKKEVFEQKRQEKLNALRSEYAKKAREIKELETNLPEKVDTTEVDKLLEAKKTGLKDLEADVEIQKSSTATEALRTNLETITKEVTATKEKSNVVEVLLAKLESVSTQNNMASMVAKKETLSKKANALRGSAEQSLKRLSEIDAELTKITTLKREIKENLKQSLDKKEKSDLLKKQSEELCNIILLNETEVLAKAESLAKEKALIEKEITEKGIELKSKEKELGGLDKSTECASCKRPWGPEHNHEAQEQALLADIAALKTAMDEASKRLNAVNESISLNQKEQKAFSLHKESSDLLLESQNLSTEAESAQKQCLNENDLIKERASLSEVSSLEAIEVELSDLDTKISEVKSALEQITLKKIELAQFTEELVALNNKESALRVNLADQLKKHTEIESDLRLKKSNLSLEIETLSKELSNLKEKNSGYDKAMTAIEVRKTDLETFKVKAEEVKAELSPYVELITRANDYIAEVETRLSGVQNKLSECDESLFVYEFWSEGFGPKGIKSFVVDDVIEILNEKTKQKLQEFGFDGAIGVRFETESVTKKGVVTSEINKVFTIDSKDKPWENMSGGQQGRIKFSVNLSIREIAEERNKNRFSNIFFDEPFENLCSSGQQTAMKLLMEIAKTKDGVVIITHDPGLQQMCSGSLYFLMKNKRSYKVSKDQFESPGSFRPPHGGESYDDKLVKAITAKRKRAAASA